MSAVSMANIAIARQQDLARGVAAPRTMARQAQAAEGQPAEAAPDQPITAALKLITSYIPTEILTLYVGGIAIFLTPTPGGKPDYAGGWKTFWVFLVLTPLMNWMVFAIKLRGAGRSLPLRPTEWPAWEMVAATIGFTFWAAALPTTPFASWERYSPQIAGYLVLVVTTFLGLISSLIHPKAQ